MTADYLFQNLDSNFHAEYAAAIYAGFELSRLTIESAARLVLCPGSSFCSRPLREM